jgi:NAD(P)-dependent dehydrogenase (short-subunit alcohol dehydrogenase family)
MDAIRTWLITGASSGFGQALAEAVLAKGEAVAVAARRTDRLDELVSRYPERSLAIAMDVTKKSDRAAALDSVWSRFGKVDVLANIAGRGSLGAAEEFTDDELREQMELNFFAAVEMTRTVLPMMRTQASGHILQLTSIGGSVSSPGFSAYCASKFALEGWSEALQAELQPLGIRLTIVEPGAFRTEFAGDKNMRPEQSIKAYKPVIEPVQRYLYDSNGKQPGDPAKAAAAMLQVVESEKPPLRLILGNDALDLFDKKLGRLKDELEQWRPVGETTSFAGASGASIDG